MKKTLFLILCVCLAALAAPATLYAGPWNGNSDNGGAYNPQNCAGGTSCP